MPFRKLLGRSNANWATTLRIIFSWNCFRLKCLQEAAYRLSKPVAKRLNKNSLSMANQTDYARRSTGVGANHSLENQWFLHHYWSCQEMSILSLVNTNLLINMFTKHIQLKKIDTSCADVLISFKHIFAWESLGHSIDFTLARLLVYA